MLGKSQDLKHSPGRHPGEGAAVSVAVDLQTLILGFARLGRWGTRAVSVVIGNVRTVELIDLTERFDGGTLVSRSRISALLMFIFVVNLGNNCYREWLVLVSAGLADRKARINLPPSWARGSWRVISGKPPRTEIPGVGGGVRDIALAGETERPFSSLGKV